MDTIINTLKGNPIFRMSLGSKELFHSNFLEYLWEVDQQAFIKMINEFILFPLNSSTSYLFGREKKNFDICIYHKDEDKDVYDVIIENKVKSIPYKEQLEGYAREAKSNNQNCNYILLSLSDQFPDKTGIANTWKIVKYNELREKINQYYINKSNICSPKDKSYIQDYCEFIKQLNDLMAVIIPPNINNQILFDQTYIKKLKEIRLHDLYIKLRCSWFVIELKKQITTHNTNMVHKFNEIKQNVVNLNVDINQGNGHIAAWICDKYGNVFEIVIQGDQYRHGINQRKITTPTKNGKEERLNELYERLSRINDQRPLIFINFDNAKNVEPSVPKKFRGKKIKKWKSGPFNCYDEDYIYRYIKIDNINNKKSIQDLITMMLNDIDGIVSNIPCLYDN